MHWTDRRTADSTVRADRRSPHCIGWSGDVSVKRVVNQFGMRTRRNHSVDTRHRSSTQESSPSQTPVEAMRTRRKSTHRDIPSSKHPKETHHERSETRSLPLPRLPWPNLHLGLPTARRTTGLRLWPAVQMWRCVRLPQGVRRVASGVATPSLFRRRCVVQPTRSSP